MNFFQYIKSKEFLSNLLAVFALSLLFLFVLGRGLKAYTNHNERIAVPNLEKLSVEEAEKVLAEQELTYVVIDSSNFNPDYPPKSIIEVEDFRYAVSQLAQTTMRNSVGERTLDELLQKRNEIAEFIKSDSKDIDQDINNLDNDSSVITEESS